MTDLKSTWVTGETYAATDQNAIAGAVNANTHARPAAGLFASRPAAGNVGAVYLSTDSQTLFRDDGTTWHAWGPVNRFLTPPSSGLSTTSLSTSTFTADKDSRLLTMPSASGFNWRVEYASLSPVSGYTATAYMETATVPASNFYSAMVLYDSGSGKLISFGMEFVSTGWALASKKWSSATTVSADYSSVGLTNLLSLPNWLRIVDDGTTRYFQYSFNGVDWILLSSVGRTDFLTPDSIGWGGSNSGGSNALIRLRSFGITNP